MSYESDASLYKLAASTAAAAAVAILQPWAFYVAAGIGVLVSNPGAMSDAAKAWQSVDHAGLMSELDELADGLDHLKKQLKTSGKWDGAAFETFEGIHTAFKNGVKSLKDTRNDTGDAVNSAAKAYHYGALVAMAVATSMFVMGMCKLAMRATPWTAIMAEGLSAVRGSITLQAVKKLLIKQGMIVAGLGGVLYMSAQQTEMTGKLFPMLEASIPTEMTAMKSGGMPPFSDAGMAYDEKMGGLTVKMDDSLTGKLPGGGTAEA
ncbi:WXG100 family type VII secretion target [Nonomuraea aurantiaca]|uniref:WXG100 family type VII secretion target n=1 Tax=Nonomuraea aurantiaca TaxID=2878562 RepID=UPI001CD9DF00|nr:WXG100 family type VII secretion target [Nonomuraea aurantiaca]MCA2224275.1 WXG100 family type VII secretion target [Nonomuraea aurantiaca]